MVPVISALVEGKLEAPWSLLAGQSRWIIKLQLQGQILSQKIRQIILTTRLSFPQSLTLVPSHLGLAEWLPQRRVAGRKRAVLPLTRWWPPFTSTSVEWASIVFSSGSQRKPEIGHEGDGDSRCVHRYQSQESHLGQRDRECSLLYLCTLVQKTQRGWGLT